MQEPTKEPSREVAGEPHERRWIWLVYVLLFALVIPWYLPEGAPLRVWLGLPHWVVISLFVSVAIAVFTAFVIHRYWEEDGEQ